MTSNNRFLLNDWHIDADTNRISKDGADIKLERKMMDVLVYLAQHQGELVTREQLENAAWGDTVVGYEALTSCIAKLRKLLDDDPKQPCFIETISKRGYRLVAEVKEEKTRPMYGSPFSRPGKINAVQFARRQQFITISIAVVLCLAALIWLQLQPEPGTSRDGIFQKRPSIVVLPFENLETDKSQDYFSDGITADITTALSKFSGLFVIAPSTATGYRAGSPKSEKVADSLGVRYILKGSIRRTRERVRVNVSLIDAERELYLWSEKYDRKMLRIFDVQDDITRNIVQSLSLKLTEEEKRRTARKYTVSLDAYDDFLRGQLHFIRHTQEDSHQAREYFQRAIYRDPHFARAYSAMALTHVDEYRYGWNGTNKKQLETAKHLSLKSLSVDDELPQAHWVSAYVYVFLQDYNKAIKASTRAIELNPNYADSYVTLAVCKLHLNQGDDALNLIAKAMLLNPGYPAAYASIKGQAYYLTNRYEEAIPLLREAIERNNNLLTAHVFLISSLGKLNRSEEANWAADKMKATAPDFKPDRIKDLLPIKDNGIISEIRELLKQAGL